MEDLSWAEIGEKMKQGYTNVIIVSASMEQHGPHLPTSTDTVIGYYLAENIARKLGKTLVAPAIRPGCTGEHPEHLPGTIEVTPEIFRETVRCYVRSLEKMGFKNMILLNTHGGQHQEVRRVWEEEKNKIKAKLIFAVDNVEYYTMWNDFWKTKGIPSRPTHSGHGGISETSLLLAASPDVVDMSRAVKGETGVDLVQAFIDLREGKIEWEEIGKRFRTKHVLETGVFGDPTSASSEGGRQLNEFIADRLVGKIRKELS